VIESIKQRRLVKRQDGILGMKFCRWLVVEQAPSRKCGTRWKCVCDCGNERIILRNSLVRGRLKSCGCLSKENAKNLRSKNQVRKEIENNENRRKWIDRIEKYDGIENRRGMYLRTRYGMSEEEWNSLFESQGRQCAICRTDTPKTIKGWHTDHDHTTGKVRGILCEHCNRGLGMFRDDITFMGRAAAYLGIHQGVLSGDAIEKAKIFAPFSPRMKHNGLSYGKSVSGYDIRIDQDLSIASKQFVLGSSMEYFNIPLDCVGMICDKSTHARRGLSLFNTIAEAGWRGYLTLELFNASDIIIELKVGDPIAQVIFLSLDAPTEQPYDGKYQDQSRGIQQAILEQGSLPQVAL